MIEVDKQYAWLADYCEGWQFGEQGMLRELARRCGCVQGVEIGAGDGEQLPVTLDFSYDLVLFEIDQQKRKKLAEKYRNATIYGAYKSENSRVISDGSIVVVDVDGCDLGIACSVLASRQPAVMCIEHYDRHGAYMTDETGKEPGSPVPDWLLGIKILDGGQTIQQPWRVVAATMEQYGYDLAALSRVNGIYVHASYKDKLNGWTD